MRHVLVEWLVVLVAVLCVNGFQSVASASERQCSPAQDQEHLTEDVLQWSDDTEIVGNMTEADMLTLIFMESTGDPTARRSGSRFYGLLQISDEYMQDALEHADLDAQPASVLMGEVRHSLQVFEWYMQRYEHHHNWRPEYVAMIHKAGPTGFNRMRRRYQQQDLTFEEAVCADETPGACQYYRRFQEVRPVYQTCLTS